MIVVWCNVAICLWFVIWLLCCVRVCLLLLLNSVGWLGMSFRFNVMSLLLAALRL